MFTMDLADFIFLRHLAEYKAAKLGLAEVGLTDDERVDLGISAAIHLQALKAYGQKVAA